MFSTLFHERFSPADNEQAAEDRSYRPGNQLDEIAVFALVAVAVFYIAVASCWFIL